MTERKNIFTNIVDKTKQIITEIKVRQQENVRLEQEWWDDYLTTPPKDGEPLTKVYKTRFGVMGGTEWRDFKWNQETQRWDQTAKYVESGFGPH